MACARARLMQMSGEPCAPAGISANFGQQQWNVWSPVSLDNLNYGTPPLVLDPNDVVICHAQLREAMNDEQQSVTTLAMYPKQPFNFAGRTGTVSFNVSNDTAGLACRVA